MKNLICAVIVAGSLFAMAEEAAPAVTEGPKPATKSRQISPEQREKMREQFFAARKAKMEAKVIGIVKKYVPDEEKAKALVKELQDALMPERRNPMRRPQIKAEQPSPTETK